MVEKVNTVPDKLILNIVIVSMLKLASSTKHHCASVQPDRAASVAVDS